MSYLTFNNGAAPATPAAGKTRDYTDSADKRRKYIDENGVISIMTNWDWKENLLINGDFTLAQRQAAATLTTYSNTTGRTYAADRWGITNENASVQYQRVDSISATETNLNARYYGRFKKITSAGKIVVSQVLEGTNSSPLRGRTVRFQAKMRFSVAGSMTVRLGLIYLTSSGTTDTIPATFVSAFGAASTDPTWGTNLTALAPVTVDGGSISGNGMTCVLTSSWVRYSATFSIPSSAKNVLAVIWTNGQPAANDELNITEAGLYDGAEIMDWTPRLFPQELGLCQRYYVKTFPWDTAPVQNGGTGGAITGILGKAGATALAALLTWRFPVNMRGTPATNTSYNPSAANAQIRQTTGTAADLTATALSAANETAINCSGTGAGTGAVGDGVAVHISCDAEI